MFSDNENPGAELSAGQTATAATAAPEQTTNVEVEQAEPPAAQTQEPLAAVAPPPAEPAVVTVTPAEPVAAPDGAAAVEHSNVAEMVEEAVETGEPPTESNAEMEQLMEQYAVPHQAPAEGEIESGQVVAITDLGVVVNLGGKTEGTDSRAGIRGTGWPVSSGGRAARGSAAHRRSQGRDGVAVVPAREAPPRLGQD